MLANVLLAAAALGSAPPVEADDAEPIIVTGERVPRALKDTPSSVAVLREHDIEERAADRLDQLLAMIPNVQLGADERLALFPHKRSDRYSRLAIGATFRQLQLRGFAPLVRLSVERNRSSIEFYDYRRTRTEFGIVRAF